MTPPYGLGRRHAPDYRDRLYPAQLALDRLLTEDGEACMGIEMVLEPTGGTP
jgi:hypothetical protein